MFEHVVNSVYIPSDDVISHRLDGLGGLLSLRFYDLNSVDKRLSRTKSSAAWPGVTQHRTLSGMAVTWSTDDPTRLKQDAWFSDISLTCLSMITFSSLQPNLWI